MAFKIQESFDVAASVEDAWAFFADPRKVVVCLPGAEVTEAIDERSFDGRVSVKVGPVTAKYEGVVRLEEKDAQTHVVRLKGEGKETGGSGSAKMSMTGRLASLGEGRTHVEVDAEIDVVGKMARFGRGVMEDVSRQLFREFAKNTQERLARIQPAARDVEEAPPSESGSSGSPSAGAAEDSSRSGHQEMPPPRREGAGTPPAGEGTQPMRLPGLLFRAVASRLKRLIGG